VSQASAVAGKIAAAHEQAFYKPNIPELLRRCAAIISDTDQIIPSREMRTVSKDQGCPADCLQANAYTEGRTPNPDFRGSIGRLYERHGFRRRGVILAAAARVNSGLGPQKNMAFALSFAAEPWFEIFHGNLTQRGLLPIPGYPVPRSTKLPREWTIDLPAQTISGQRFEIGFASAKPARSR